VLSIRLVFEHDGREHSRRRGLLDQVCMQVSDGRIRKSVG
jgi:hypothetical protein